MVVDQLGLEKLGIPTVSIVTSSFVKLAAITAAAERAADLCRVVVPHPLGMIPPTEVEAKAEEAFPRIVAAATQWQPDGQPSPEEAYRSVVKFTGTVEELNGLFLERGWSLGLPAIPPTTQNVRRMLGGTARRPDEVIGLAPPLMAPLTVETIAANAVMAGCLPDHLPVLITALEALLDPAVGWRGALATTATSQTVVIVNGPIVKEIGIACEQGAAGKGHHANAAIGYAINLVAHNVGHSRPPDVDKSTFASPGDIVCWVFGENEGALPADWAPLHVERGFKKSDDVVTVMASYPPVDNLDHHSVTAEEHVRWWSHLCTPLIGGGGPAFFHTAETNPLVALGPEHASLVASGGWSKDDFRRAFWEQARLPLATWPSGCPDVPMLEEHLGPLRPESLIPLTLKPDQFLVVIAGGSGKHSHYFPSFRSYAVSRQVVR